MVGYVFLQNGCSFWLNLQNCHLWNEYLGFHCGSIDSMRTFNRSNHLIFIKCLLCARHYWALLDQVLRRKGLCIIPTNMCIVQHGAWSVVGAQKCLVNEQEQMRDCSTCFPGTYEPSRLEAMSYQCLPLD